MKIYDRLTTFTVELVVEAIQAHMDLNLKVPNVDKRVDFQGHKVKLSSLRLKTFLLKGLNCAECGLEGTLFALEKHSWDKVYHLNLWGINENGQEVLMTHDHILARSLGGADNLSNTQTMCTVCNFRKGKLEQEIKNDIKQKRKKVKQKTAD